MKTNVDDESSSEIRPVISPTIDQNLTDTYSLVNNDKLCPTNSIQESTEQTKSLLSDDPWIRRCDQSSIRPYYRSLSSTSDECLTQQHRHLLINTVDKDIEYVESRLRGQTTISLPNCTSNINFQRLSNRNYLNNQQQISQKYLNPIAKQQNNGSTTKLTTTTPKCQTNEGVKTVKRRIDKVKDQKAAKTLR